LPNAEWLFINSVCNYCNGSLHNPVTALVSLLFLDASADPFGGFADFSSAAASASFPSSQGRINLQIEMLLKWRKSGRDAMWHLIESSFLFQGKLCLLSWTTRGGIM